MSQAANVNLLPQHAPFRLSTSVTVPVLRESNLFFVLDDNSTDALGIFSSLSSLSDAFRHHAIVRGIWDDVEVVVPLIGACGFCRD